MSVVSEDQYQCTKERFVVWPSIKRNPLVQEQLMTQDNEIGFKYKIPWDDTGESILQILELRACEVPDMKGNPLKME